MKRFMPAMYLGRMRTQPFFGRYFIGNRSYDHDVAELNKEMESIFGEPPPGAINPTSPQEPEVIRCRSSESQQGLTHVDSGGQTKLVDVSSKSESQQGLTHVDSGGQAKMVDVSSKCDSKRVAIAACRVLLGRKAFDLVASNQMAKGDVLTVAKVAGINGAKQTSSLIPMCHSIGLTHIRVDLALNEKDLSIDIEGEVATTGKTGVEMEAMTAVAVAGLTVYDMCKAASKEIHITDIRLEHKTGGKSGSWSRKQ